MQARQQYQETHQSSQQSAAMDESYTPSAASQAFQMMHSSHFQQQHACSHSNSN